MNYFLSIVVRFECKFHLITNIMELPSTSPPTSVQGHRRWPNKANGEEKKKTRAPKTKPEWKWFNSFEETRNNSGKISIKICNENENGKILPLLLNHRFMSSCRSTFSLSEQNNCGQTRLKRSSPIKSCSSVASLPPALHQPNTIM